MAHCVRNCHMMLIEVAVTSTTFNFFQDDNFLRNTRKVRNVCINEMFLLKCKAM